MKHKLQKAILRVAASNEKGMDLRQTALKGTLLDLPYGDVEDGEAVLAVGSPPALSASMKGAKGSWMVISADREHGASKNGNGHAGGRLVRSQFDDLSTDPAFVDELLQRQPVQTAADYQRIQEEIARQRDARPLIGDDSVDVVFVDELGRRSTDRARGLLQECFRVMRRGGRLHLGVLLADEPLPATAERPVECIPQEQEILSWLEACGFHGMQITARADLPLKVIEGVEIRMHTLAAYKGKQGACYDTGHAVVYKGPWSKVHDDDDHTYVRGQRTAVCEKTFKLLQRRPYRGEFLFLPAYVDLDEEDAPLFDCNTPQIRDPKVTKGIKAVDESAGDACEPSSGCC